LGHLQTLRDRPEQRPLHPGSGH